MLLLPLALSRTQDDKGRVRWTLFGGSEQGPAAAFWRGLLPRPAAGTAARVVARTSSAGCWPPPTALTPDELADLRRAGFRVSAGPARRSCPPGDEGPLPAGPPPIAGSTGDRSAASATCLLSAPSSIACPGGPRAYLDGRSAPAALPRQPGLLRGAAVSRSSSANCRWPCRSRSCIRCTGTRPRGASAFRSRAGCTRPPRADRRRTKTTARSATPSAAPTAGSGSTGTRTRWPSTASEDKLTHVLLSTAADDVGLYGKPMARNAQIWTHEYQLAAGRAAGRRRRTWPAPPTAGRRAGCSATACSIRPMRVGRHEVYWHRPLVAYLDPRDAASRPSCPTPRWVLAAYRVDRPRLAGPWSFGRGCWIGRRTARPSGLFAVHEHALPADACSTSASCSDAWRLLRPAAACRRASPGSCSRCPRTRRWTTGCIAAGPHARLRRGAARRPTVGSCSKAPARRPPKRRGCGPVVGPTCAATKLAVRAAHLTPSAAPPR